MKCRASPERGSTPGGALDPSALTGATAAAGLGLGSGLSCPCRGPACRRLAGTCAGPASGGLGGTGGGTCAPGCLAALLTAGRRSACGTLLVFATSGRSLERVRQRHQPGLASSGVVRVKD